MLKVGSEQGDRELSQLEVGQLFLMVGDDRDIEESLRIGLSQHRVDRRQDGLVAFVCRNEDDKSILVFSLLNR